MAKTSAGPSGARRKPDNDIYTVLVSIALIAVAGGIAFVIYRCTELLGTPFPGFQG